MNITFPEPGLKSEKVTIRGPKPDVDACYKYLQKMHEDMKINNYSVEVPIYKQHHKFIIGKGGVNIKKVRKNFFILLLRLWFKVFIWYLPSV